jgi:hypothetical protein
MAALCPRIVFAPRTLSCAASMRGSRQASCNTAKALRAPRLHKNAWFVRSALPLRAMSSSTAEVPTLEELLARLQRGEAPAGGFDALAFTLPTSDAASCITARMMVVDDDDEDATRDVPAGVMRAIEAHVLPARPDVYMGSASDGELLHVVSGGAAAAHEEIYPPGCPCVMLYIYPLADDAVWVYDTPPDAGAGLSLRDVVRCVAATYKVIYAAEECAVGAEAHAARAGPRIYNRGATDGPFGIWGHDLGELVLESFSWAPRVEGSGGALLPSIGS